MKESYKNFKKKKLVAAKFADASDPLQKFGPAIGAHHFMLIFLIGLFGIMYIWHLPIFAILDKHGFYKGESTKPWVLGSIGSMGFADSRCDLHQMVKHSP